MSSMDDKAPLDIVGPSAGKSLVPVVQGESASQDASAPESGRRPSQTWRVARWIAPVAFLAIAGGAGWYAGAHSTLAASVSQRAAAEVAIASELKAQSAALAAIDARLKGVEGARGAEVSLKPAIDILAQRIDEIARRQTAALSQTSSRLDRSDKDIGVRLDRMSERIERLEKQVSSAAPVGSTQKNVSAVSRAAEPAGRASDAEEKAVRGYVLRDVFQGGALIESRYGLMEVFPGVQLPGAGRVRSVEKRDGRWVVVTTAGLIETNR